MSYKSVAPFFPELVVPRILFQLTTSHHCRLVPLFVLALSAETIELNARVARLWGPSSELLGVDLSQPIRGQGSVLPTCFPEAFPHGDYEGYEAVLSWM